MAPPVAGYTAWYDATLITGVADGAALSSWPDSSGNGHTLTQATGANQPTYYKTTTAKLLNGQPAVWFNAGQVMATTGMGVLAQPCTFVFVAECLNGGSVPVLFNTGSGNVLVYVNTTVWTVNAASAAATTLTPGTSLHFGAVVLNGASTVVYQDAASQTVNPGSNTWGQTTLLGANSAAAANPWSGPVGEFIIYPSALTSGQISSLYSYVQAKWLTPAPVTSTACAVTIGPLTTTVASPAVTVGGCGRGAWLTLGALSVNLEDASRGYFCSQLDLGWPTSRAVVANRPDADGEIDRTQFMGPRVVSANITAVNGPGPGIDAVASMFAPFMAPSARPVLHYVLNRPGVGERTLTVRGTGYSWPIAGPASRSIQLQWEAADPIARDPVVHTATATPAAAAGITSPGDVPVRPLFRITGPITAPAVTLTTAGAPTWTIAFLPSFTVAAGHFVDVDTAARTVYLDANPAQPRLSSVDWTQSSWQWIPPSPVTATMALGGTSTSGATQVTATFQDGYLT
jgi:hypothetical protein